MPVNDPLVSLGMILDAEIGDDYRRKIASANRKAIIEGNYLFGTGHAVCTDHEGYEPLWLFADERCFSIPATSWSLTDYNRAYDNVYTDIAGDIFCYRMIDSLTKAVSPEKILFGSNFPWFDPTANLTRVLLAGIGERDKESVEPCHGTGEGE